MTSRVPLLARWSRYGVRIREAGVGPTLQILATRARGYLQWPVCAAAKMRGKHVAPQSLWKRPGGIEPGQPLALFWNDQDISQKMKALRGRQAALAVVVVDQAERVLQEGTPLLGWGLARWSMPIAWQSDARTGFSWTRHFHKRIDTLQEGETCDVKYPWERSRLQILPRLAQAWVASGDSRYLDAVGSILADWSAENPAGYGVNWTCAMEVAIRAINIGAAANLLQGAFSEEGSAFLRALLQSHERHLRANLEWSEVNGNHLFFDRLGIALLRLQLEGPLSNTFQAAAKELAAESDRQFLADGVHLEHATSYHRLVLEGALLFLHATRGLKGPAFETMNSVVERGMSFLDAISLPDGSLPSVGDDDSGSVLWLGSSRANHGGIVLALGTAAGVGPTGGHGGQDDIVRFWFSLPSEPLPERGGPTQTGWRLQAFRNAGYFVLRGKGVHLLLKAGPSGLHGRGSHDHNDQLSMVLSIDGRPLLVDPGTRTYTEDLELHERDLSTRRHNTISLDGLEQSPIHHGSVTRAVRSAQGTCDRFEAGLDGRIIWEGRVSYGGQPSGSTHHRRVEVSEEEGGRIAIEVRDELDRSPGEAQEASAQFMLAPQVRVRQVDTHRVDLLDGDARTIRVEGTHPLRLEPDSVSSEYGSEQPTNRISMSMGTAVQSSVRLTFSLYRSQADGPAGARG